jgi:hypothetical protein
MPQKNNAGRRPLHTEDVVQGAELAGLRGGLRRQSSLSVWIKDAALECWQTMDPAGRLTYDRGIAITGVWPSWLLQKTGLSQDGAESASMTRSVTSKMLKPRPARRRMPLESGSQFRNLYRLQWSSALLLRWPLPPMAARCGTSINHPLKRRSAIRTVRFCPRSLSAAPTSRDVADGAARTS